MRFTYYPFYLRDKDLLIAVRLTSWTRDHHLWTYINNDHVLKCVWPALYPHPLCDGLITDDYAL